MKTPILAAALASATPLAAETYKGYDTPQYTVVLERGAFEVRDYQPALMAEVTMRTTQSAALRQGFQILAGYIFGGNTSADKVAMTSPVAQTAGQSITMTSPVAQSGADGMWTVAFMMPPSYTRDTLPTPKNDAIRFVETTPSRQVVITFGGWATASRLQAKEVDLRAFAAANGLNVQGPAQYLIYDDPMTVPWNRRNEVALMLE